MTTSVLISVTQVATSVSAGLTAFRLGHTGLYRRYPTLFAYMVFAAIYSLAPLVLDTRGPTYFWVWIWFQPVQWLLDILVVRELCRVILERHPGLVTLGRWGMYAGVAVAAFLSFLSLLPHIDSTMPERSRRVAYWVAAGRGVTFGLAIFLILMLFALSRYPVPLSRNVILNALLFTLVFLSDSMTAILRTIFDRRMSPWMAAAAAAVEACWLFLWFLLLNPEGERARFDWIRFGAAYEKRVLEQLDALSRMVGRAH
jgi:hypothetical protein